MRRLYQQVADHLREQITSGAYAIDQRMPAERDLAKQFNVSRPTVREAIIALEIEGLVEVRTGSGVYVVSTVATHAGPTDYDVGPFELVEARRAIEGEVCAAAAVHINNAQLAHLDHLIGVMQAEHETPNQGENWDRDFHMTIADATQNPAFVAAVAQLWNMRDTSPMLIAMRKARHGGTAPRLRDHEMIFKALNRRDPHAARNAMHAHLNRVLENLLRQTEVEAMKKARGETNALRTRFRVPPRKAEPIDTKAG